MTTPIRRKRYLTRVGKPIIQSCPTQIGGLPFLTRVYRFRSNVF